MTDSNAARPMRAEASQVDTSYTPQGAMSSLLATGTAQVAFTERRAGVPDLAREMRGDKILATFKQVAVDGHKSVSRLSEVHATGGASAKGDAFAAATKDHAAEVKTNSVIADDLRAVFDVDAGKNPQVRQLVGSGSTKLQQSAAQGAQQSSIGDSLDIEFAHGATASGAQISSATQVGHVLIHSVPAGKPGATTTPVPADASEMVLAQALSRYVKEE